MTNSISTADALIAALREPGREHLVDLVRNPLRLTLLCMTWDGLSLPETQAELYDRYLRKMYGWNRNLQVLRDHARCCGMTSTQLKQELNRELGELAKAAFNLPRERFRLSQVLMEEYLGEELDESSLACLALRLGWLNRVGRDGRGDFIFAFYHATFQEYFAALAVEDWDYFLPKDHVDCPVVGKEYRIFEKQWKQVILFWLGRGDIGEEKKEGFIRALVEFEDGVEDFYGEQAYILAAVAINQFKTCSRSGEIVQQVIKWSFGYFNIEKQEWRTFLHPESARQVIPETIRSLAISALIDILNRSPDEDTRAQAAKSLGQIGVGNTEAIAKLLDIIRNTENEETRWQAASSLRKVGKRNEDVISELLEVISTTKNENIRWQAAWSLGKIDPGNPQAIAELLDIIRITENEETRWQAASRLSSIDPGSPQAIVGLLEVIRTTEEIFYFHTAVFRLSKIGVGNPDVISGLLDIINTTDNQLIRCIAVDSFKRIGKGSSKVVSGLLNIIRIINENTFNTSQNIENIASLTNEDTRGIAFYVLGEIGEGNSDAIAGLLDIIRTTENEDIRRQAAWSLGKIDPGNSEAIAEFLDIIRITENENIRRQSADSLWEIDPGNSEAITGLLDIIRTTENENIRRQAADSLGKIDPGNSEAIAGLLDIIRTTENEDIRRQAADSLWKIDPGNSVAVVALINLIATTENESTCRQAAENLGEIITTPQQYAGVVSPLKDNLSDEVRSNNFDRFKVSYKLIWKCAENLPYPEFYQAWHNPPTTPHPEIENNTPTGPTPFTQHHNLTLLPQILNQTNPTNHQIICIDTNRFSDPTNPALQIYTTLKKAGCPPINDKPRTIPELQAYCGDELSNHQIALILHQQPTNLPPQNLDLGVLNQLARFSHPPIALILPQPLPDCQLPQFLENDPNLIPTILQWLQNLER